MIMFKSMQFLSHILELLEVLLITLVCLQSKNKIAQQRVSKREDET